MSCVPYSGIVQGLDDRAVPLYAKEDALMGVA